MTIPKRRDPQALRTCHNCRANCHPKDGDWHEGEGNQVFLCRGCEVKRPPVRGKLRTWNLPAPETA